MSEIKFYLAGECGLLVKWADEISEGVNQQVRRFLISLQRKELVGVKEIIPAYCSVLIEYDPVEISLTELKDQVLIIADNLENEDIPPPRVYKLPTCYGGEYGPDLGYVAEYNGLTEPDVIKIHSQKQYLIYMLGFSPGFPYLGGLKSEIATPRRTNPRKVIPQGSVGIANQQTGVYPSQTPGGWQLIGRTPILLFDVSQIPPALLEAGSYVQFAPISVKEYRKLVKEVSCYEKGICST